MSNKFIPIPSAVLLGKITDVTNVATIAIDILPVHSLISNKMAEVGESDLIIPAQVSSHSY